MSASKFFGALGKVAAIAIAAEAARIERERLSRVTATSYTVYEDGYGNKLVTQHGQQPVLPVSTGNAVADRLQGRIDGMRNRYPNAGTFFRQDLAKAEQYLDQYLLRGDDYQAKQCAQKISDAEFWATR